MLILFLPSIRAGLLIAAVAGLGAACAVSAAAAKPAIVKREQWKARAGNAAIMKRHKPRAIIIHMTGVRMQPRISLEKKMRGLQGYSIRRARIGARMRDAWGDVPYHFYIGASGRIAEGRDIAYAGDTNTGYRTSGYIQVVVEGEFNREKPNARQVASLRKLVVSLARRYGVPASRITGHNDHAATSCPGRHLKVYLPMLRKTVGR